MNGDGKLSLFGDDGNDGDVRYLGDQNPRYNFSLNFSCDYKGFDFSFFLQGVGKRTLFLEAEASRPFSQWWFDPLEYWYGKTWTTERVDAKYPAITVDQIRGSYNYAPSNNTKFNAAYIRMKNMQVGYSLPKSLLRKINIEKSDSILVEKIYLKFIMFQEDMTLKIQDIMVAILLLGFSHLELI